MGKSRSSSKSKISRSARKLKNSHKFWRWQIIVIIVGIIVFGVFVISLSYASDADINNVRERYQDLRRQVNEQNSRPPDTAPPVNEQTTPTDPTTPSPTPTDPTTPPPTSSGNQSSGTGSSGGSGSSGRPSSPGSSGSSSSSSISPEDTSQQQDGSQSSSSGDLYNESQADRTAEQINREIDNIPADDLPTLSGVQRIQVNTNDPQNASLAGYYLDNKLYYHTTRQPFGYNLDTTRLQNGTYRLDVIVFDQDLNQQERFIYRFNVNNDLSVWHNLLNVVTYPFYIVLDRSY